MRSQRGVGVVRRFKVQDSNAAIYEVVETELASPNFTPVATGRRQHLPAGSQLHLADGRDVSSTDEPGIYILVETGERLTEITG